MPFRPRVAVMSVVLTAAVLSSCSEPAAPEEPEPQPTPIAAYDGTRTRVARTEFCDRVPADAIELAVGEVKRTRHYRSGDPLPTRNDIGHEHGCAWVGASATARAWVFVPPVTPSDARRIVASTRKVPGCTPVPARRFGTPSAGDFCKEGKGRTVTYRGLFGDAWLSCSLSVSTAAKVKAPVLAKRAGVWCVQVATSLTP